MILNGDGYTDWKRSMTIALIGKNKMGFVDGTIPQPDPTSSLFTTWQRVNNVVMGWLLGTVELSILEVFIGSKQQEIFGLN